MYWYNSVLGNDRTIILLFITKKTRLRGVVVDILAILLLLSLLTINTVCILEFETLQDYFFYSGFHSGNCNVSKLSKIQPSLLVVRLILSVAHISSCPLHTNSGCGKKEVHKKVGPWRHLKRKYHLLELP